MKNVCASCKSVNIRQIIKTDKSKLPKWLEEKDYVSEFIEKTPIKLYKKSKYNMKYKLNVGKHNKYKYILYWGAQSSNSMIIRDAKKAYGKFKNHGVTKVAKNGDVTFYFDCPQPYSTIEKGKKQKETFYRHIHFCFSNKQDTDWLETVYTKVIICDIDLKKMLNMHRSGKIVLINALPESYYAKSHIPNSYNLFNKKIKKMTQSQLFSWFQEVIKLNYPVIHKLIQSRKINLYEIPIVVYCAGSYCDAAYLSAIELLKKGFVNVMEYKEGMDEYNKHF